MKTMETFWSSTIPIVVLLVTSVAGCARSGFHQGRGGGATGTSGAAEVPSPTGGMRMPIDAKDAEGTGGGWTDRKPTTTVDTFANPVPPDRCQPIEQLPAGRIPVCRYLGGKPGQARGCSRFPINLFLDEGSYYFMTTESPGILQCPRNRTELAVEQTEGTSTAAGVVQESLSVKVLEGGLIDFRCRTDEPDGPGYSNEILCSDTGIQIIPADKGRPFSLEFPGTATTPDMAGYLGWLTYEKLAGSDCRSSGDSFQIDYTSLSSFPTLSPTLGSQPVTCTVSNGSKILSFKDLLGQRVTLVFDSSGSSVIDVRWQQIGAS